MSFEAISPHPVEDITRDTADFSLDPEETAKGGRVVASLLDSLKDGRQTTQEALDALALVMSGGACSADEFPWQQVRAHHGAAAMTFLREEGAPARVEHYRCSRDETRKYQQVPASYDRKDVQRYRTTLRKVLEECWNLGLLSEEERERTLAPPSGKVSRDRTVSASEFRAILSICERTGKPEGLRDALILSLAFHSGLKIPELLALRVDDLNFDGGKGQVTVRIRTPKGQRNRSAQLYEGSLVALEDWMAARGNGDGPLLCSVQRGRVEVKRMTAAAVRLACQKRSEEAGVELFSPNDLRKSGEALRGARRRNGRTRQHSVSAGAIALYGEDPENEPQADLIQFPFRNAIR